jgi:hypothetical protein
MHGREKAEAGSSRHDVWSVSLQRRVERSRLRGEIVLRHWFLIGLGLR